MIDFVAIDFETANEKRNSACSIGITCVRNGDIVNRFSSLIRPPELRFTFWNSRVHGITEEHVRDAPTFGELWPDILKLISDQIVVAHNATFDISVLRHSLNTADIPTPQITYLCSLQVARSVWPNLPSYSLAFVADFLKIPLTHHVAESDSLACAEVILRSAINSSARTIKELADQLTIDFGKVFSSEFWIPTSAPLLCRTVNSSVEIQIPDGFNISSHAFFNKQIAITGELRLFKRKDAFRFIEQLGGIPSESVSKKTSYLITGFQNAMFLADGATESSKLQKAKKLRANGLDIQIISEADFSEMIFTPQSQGMLNE